MSLPVGVQTVTVNFGPILDFQGAPAAGETTFTPTAMVTHIPSGTPLIPRPISVVWDGAGSGSVVLPAVDSVGLDRSDWAYQVVHRTYTAGVPSPPGRTIRPLAAAPVIDLDLLVDSVTPSGLTVSQPAVVSVAGLTGAPTAQQVATALTPALGAAFGLPALLGSRRNLPHLSRADAVMATPPTVGAASTTSTITSGVLVPSISGSGTATALLTDRIGYRAGGAFVAAGTAFPGNQYVKATSLTTTSATSSPFCADIITDAPLIEVKYNGGGDKFRIRVDGELVSAAPITAANDGSFYFLPLTFPTRTLRRISVENGASSKFAGFQVGPNDTVEKPVIRGPRCIVVGDSFTEGTGATAGAATNWVRRFGEAMGWDDVWASGVGGTGYLNPGTGGRVKFRDRLTNDVLNQSPQIVIWAGGINDQTTYTAAATGAEALACYQAVQAGIPGVVQIVLSPFWPAGVETYNTALIDTRDAIKASAAAANTAAQPVYFIDLLEMPLGATALTTTLSSASSASATTLSIAGFIPKGATIEVDTAASRERRVVTAVAGVGPYSLTVAAMTGAHASGVGVRQVGPGYMTGSGNAGTPSGSGNADLFRSSDGTHPTQAGHEHIGTLVRSLIARQILAG